MEKTSFDIFADMHRADLKNDTGNVGMSPYFIEAKQTQQGGIVTMGVSKEVLVDMMNDKVMVMLLVINKEEYKRLKPGTGTPEQQK